MSSNQQSAKIVKKEENLSLKKTTQISDNQVDDILSSQEQQIQELQEDISRKLQQMKLFQQQMKKRRIEQQIDEKEQENPFVVKQTYIDRQLKKLNTKSEDLKIVKTGQEDEIQMQRKVQQILKKINH